MVVGSFTVEHVSPFPPSKIWTVRVTDSLNLLPKAMPERLARMETIEGDGGVGTVRKLTFVPDFEFAFAKDRIDFVDHNKYVYKYSIVEGGFIGKTMKSYCFELTLEPTADGGSKSKIAVEYDTIGEALTVEQLNAFKRGVEGMGKAIDRYLQANPSACA